MLERIIIYTSILIAFIAFFIFYDKGFSLKNSLTMSLFSPLLGGLLIIAGVFSVALILGLVTFGTIIYILNRKKLIKFKSKNMKFKVYRIWLI